jgi:hypothetical protein
MQQAQEAVSQVAKARADARDQAVKDAVEQCVVNAQWINQLLIQRVPKTTFRLFDESKVWELVDAKAAQLASQRIQLNVSMQNEMRANIDRLERELTLTREQNLALQENAISLQSTLEANEEKFHKWLVEQHSAAELREELEQIDSFEVNVLDKGMFPTPKKPAPMPRDGAVGKNLFGSQELKDKLKY